MGERTRWGVVVALLMAMASPALAVKPSLPSAPTSADCEHLLGQFDVAWSSHSALKRADAARRARDLGEAACREGRYGDGIHQLKRALQDLGLRPVHRASSIPSR
jgi:hypothetical protein